MQSLVRVPPVMPAAVRKARQRAREQFANDAHPQDLTRVLAHELRSREHADFLTALPRSAPVGRRKARGKLCSRQNVQPERAG